MTQTDLQRALQSVVEFLNTYAQVTDGEHERLKGPGSQALRGLREEIRSAFRGSTSDLNRRLAGIQLRFRASESGVRLVPIRRLSRAQALALDAALVLQDESVRSRLRLCDECGWAFVDSSKNGRTRFCSVIPCANRWRVRAFRSRKV